MPQNNCGKMETEKPHSSAVVYFSKAQDIVDVDGIDRIKNGAYHTEWVLHLLSYKLYGTMWCGDHRAMWGLIGTTILLLCGLIGLPSLNVETRPSELWVPEDARALRDNALASSWFAPPRVQQILLHEANVLENIQKIYGINDAVETITISEQKKVYGLADICFKAGFNCLELSILELDAWNWTSTDVNSLNLSDVLEKVNTANPFVLNEVLGGIGRNERGQIESAEVAALTYFVATKDVENPEKRVMKWEEAFLDVCTGGSLGENVYCMSHRSVSDMTFEGVVEDMPFVLFGMLLSVLFVVVNMAAGNRFNQRIYVALSCVGCSILSFIFSVGLASLFGFSYGPLHIVIFYIIHGVTVVKCFIFFITFDISSVSYEYGMALVYVQLMSMLMAGVPIFTCGITSALIFIAAYLLFDIPALESFAVFGAFGVVGSSLFVILFFSSILIMNYERMRKNKDACCWCVKYPDGDIYLNMLPPKGPAKVVHGVIARVRNFNRKRNGFPYLLFKIVAIIVAFVLLAVGVIGVAKQKQEFDHTWMIPEESYLAEYLEVSEKYFPRKGYPASLYFGELNYFSNSTKLLQLNEELKNLWCVNGATVRFWLADFYQWFNFTSTNDSEQLNPQTFGLKLMQFFYTTGLGQQYLKDIKQGNEPNSSFSIRASRVSFDFITMENSTMRVKAMRDSRKLLDSYDLGQDMSVVYGYDMLSWESDAVILENTRLVLLVGVGIIFVVHLVLTLNLKTSILATLTVAMTVTDVAGFMYFWDVPINNISANNLVVSMVLSLEIVTHCSMVMAKVSKDDIPVVVDYLTSLRLAVLRAGVANYLAYIPLSFASFYLFKATFKMMLLTIVFGVFHAVVFIPSVCGLLPCRFKRKTGEELEQEQEARRKREDEEEAIRMQETKRKRQAVVDDFLRQERDSSSESGKRSAY